MVRKGAKRQQIGTANGMVAVNMCSAPTPISNDICKSEKPDTQMERKSPKHHIDAKDRWGRLKTTVNAISHVHVKKKSGLDRGDSFLRKFSTRNTEDKIEANVNDNIKFTIRNKHGTCWSMVVHPAGEVMFYWLGIVTIAVLYNLWTCIARETFREIQNGYTSVWICLDAFCDFIYILDIVVQFRTGYLLQGLMVYDSHKLCKNYMKNRYFIVDLVCLLPLDFLQFAVGIHPMLRFPRFLKVYRSVRFMHVYESRTAYPNLLRVLSLSHILFLGAHWFAAFYYLISEAEGFNGDWSYPQPVEQYAEVTRKYLASLYWSTLTLTTIGDLPPPDTNWQYAFVIVSYLIGVFIFATIVGQVGNVITNRNASRQEFERLLDGAKFYMQTHDVPKDLQKRVQRWYDYVWTRGRLNCNDINSLGLLPDKLKTELALHVNLGTLRQVTIFQKCRPEFLHDLMLKMRAYIFTPGDLICRRGEVAREMFIIADGVVEILGESSTVLTQMSTGDFFGEIGILNLDGGINRRTADVVSVGYSELFVLSREDVLAALKDHPDAEQIIREYGQRRLREMEEHRKMVKSAPNSPLPEKEKKRASQKEKKSDSNSHHFHLPQLKYIQKLPSVSPRLKRVLSLKNSLKMSRHKRKVVRRKSSDERQIAIALEKLHQNMNKRVIDNNLDRKEDEDIEEAKFNRTNNAISYGHSLAVPNLNVIAEGSSASDTESDDLNDRDESSKRKTSLADVVIKILKMKKRAQEYSPVDTNFDDDDDNQFNNIKIANISDIASSVHSNNRDTDSRYQLSDAINHSKGNPCNYGASSEFHGENPVNEPVKTDNPVKKNARPVAPNSLPLPKIVLPSDTNMSSSDADSSDNDKVKEKAPNTPLPKPNPVTRDEKQSTNVLQAPLNFDRFTRRISCPPPLDLPIEVPRLSRFRGLSPVNNDIQENLNTFKETVDRRLGHLEKSYKQTIRNLEETARRQDEMLRTVFQRIPQLNSRHETELQNNTSTEHEVTHF